MGALHQCCCCKQRTGEGTYAVQYISSKVCSQGSTAPEQGPPESAGDHWDLGCADHGVSSYMLQTGSSSDGSHSPDRGKLAK